MFVVAMTGGIASGKTQAANYFAQLGIDIIDTDQIARQVVEPGSSALKKIHSTLGNTVIDQNGHLNRSKLREIIFADADKRQWLEALLHPLIRQETLKQIQQAKSAYCIVVIPLLVETGIAYYRKIANRFLVIDSPESLQKKRLQQRDHLTPSSVNNMLKAQANREQRLAIADDVIHNDKDLAALEKQVTKLHQHYLNLTLTNQDGL